MRKRAYLKFSRGCTFFCFWHACCSYDLKTCFRASHRRKDESHAIGNPWPFQVEIESIHPHPSIRPRLDASLSSFGFFLSSDLPRGTILGSGVEAVTTRGCQCSLSPFHISSFFHPLSPPLHLLTPWFFVDFVQSQNPKPHLREKPS